MAVGPSASVPSDAVVEALVAGDDEGWVMTSGAESAARDLWRVQLGGNAERAAEVPELASPDMARLGEGVAVAGVECRSGGVEDCAGVVASVYVIAGDGEVSAPVRVWERDGALEGGDGLAIVGSTDDSVWVEHDGGLSEVTNDGQVSGEFARPDGSVCVLEGSPYALVVDAPPRDGESSDGPPTGQASPERAITVTHTVLALDSQGWEPVPSGAQTFSGVGPVAACTPDGFSVQSVDGGQFFGGWAPGSGWAIAAERGVPVALPPAAQRALDPYEASLFAFDADGTVFRRVGADYEPTALQLADTAPRQGAPPASIVADASNSVTVACVTSLPPIDFSQPDDASGGASTIGCDVAL